MERLMTLLFQTGGIEHTNDWDIRINFTLNNGTELTNEDIDDDSYSWTDTFTTPIKATEDLQVISRDRIKEVTELEVEVYGNDTTGPKTFKVKIEDIAKFYIGD